MQPCKDAEGYVCGEQVIGRLASGKVRAVSCCPSVMPALIRAACCLQVVSMLNALACWLRSMMSTPQACHCAGMALWPVC